MPRWAALSRSYNALQRRLGLQNQPATEGWNGLLQVIQADRHWHSEDLRMFGAVGVSWGAGDPDMTTARHHTVSLHNPTDDRELLVYRAAGWVSAGFDTSFQVPGSHIFTPLEAYYELQPAGPYFPREAAAGPPVILDPFAFPWVQTGTGPGDNTIDLGSAHLDQGTHSALQAVTVQPLGVFSTIGPRHVQTGALAAAGAQPALGSRFQGPDSPPLRLKPRQRLALQSLVAHRSTSLQGLALEVEFWWSERAYEGEDRVA